MASSPGWGEELLSRLLDHSWDPRLPEFLHEQADKPGLARADVRLNVVDLCFDLEAHTVTIFGLWAEDGGLPEAVVPLATFWRAIDARADGQDWRACLRG